MLGEPGRGPVCGGIFIPGGGGKTGLGEEDALFAALDIRGLLMALEFWREWWAEYGG
jgi:hypothetical protein